MKIIIYYIKKIWFYLFGNKIDKINLKLEKAAIDESLNRMKLKKEISQDLKKAFNISFNKKSKFIPAKGHNKAKIYNYVNNKFGQSMSKRNLNLTKTLIWK